LKTVPPAGGFWELGEFDKKQPGMTNPWRGASRMAPFDQEVLQNIFKYSFRGDLLFYIVVIVDQKRQNTSFFQT